MRQVYGSVLFVAWLVVHVHCCTNADWWDSMDHQGYSTCNNKRMYINGLWRNDNGGDDDGTHLIELARCCLRPRPYRNQPTQCLAADWEHSFNLERRWNYCPAGFFLQGLYKGDDIWLHNIEYGKCCKPANHPYYWGACYDQDVSLSFDKKGFSKCKDGYFITGLYRGTCDKLYCIETFKCCEMFPSPPVLQSLADVKTRVMDTTMYQLSDLAFYLGYAWCSGCRAQYVGEDFRRNGDSWEADKKPPCKGFQANDRLKMHYGDFKFSIKDIKYGEPKIQSLNPTVFDSGKVTNTDPTPLKQSIEREIRSVRTVTHTTTSSWKKSHELGLEISYTPPSATGGVGGKINYKFNYENSQTTTDSTSNQQYSSFKIVSEKTLRGHSAAKWQIMLSKTRTTVPYTAVILVHFSAQLDGFLRWGGGYNGDWTNYHYQHRGSGDRPSFPYRFGDASVPFYQALKRQSTQSMRPWLWTDIKNRYRNAQAVINNLINENQYEFTLSGQFEDVVGQHADVQWKKTVPANDKRSVQPAIDVTEELDDPIPSQSPPKVDPPRVFPPPPKVTIGRGNFTEVQPIKISEKSEE